MKSIEAFDARYYSDINRSILEQRESEQYADLVRMIQKAAEEGEFEICIPEKVYRRVSDVLIRDGYEVLKMKVPLGADAEYVISWRYPVLLREKPKWYNIFRLIRERGYNKRNYFK